MRHSGAENSLVYEWLALLRRHYRLYNVDNTHRCHRTATHQQHLLTPEEEELRARKRRRQSAPFACSATTSSVVQPFVWAPQFYGCVECGRYHFCRRDERECEVVYNEQDHLLTCLHSGQVLREAVCYEVGTYDGEQHFEQDACQDDASALPLSSGRSQYTFKSTSMLYSNTRVRQPLCTQEQLEELERCEVRDDERRDRKKRDEGRVQPVVESMEIEMQPAADETEHEAAEGVTCIVEQCNQSRLKNRHDNRLYWNAYFAFLLQPAEGAPMQQQPLHESESARLAVQWPDPLALWQPYQPKPMRTIGLGPEACTVVEHCAYEVVTRLMKAQHRTLQRKQPRDIDALNRRIVAQLLPVLCNVLALAQLQQRASHAPPGTQENALRTSCVALILFGLSESFWDMDSHGTRIEIWHRDPWLGALERAGVTEQLFAPRRSKHLRSKKKSVTHYDRAQVKSAQTQLGQHLSHYRGHAHWLRNFVLNGID